MSDFDKEAERERLREKYERDEQKREVTERMSELLLKGATMTNAHCQECGDPIFRYDDQEFCPTCERAVQRDTGDSGQDGQRADEDDDSVTSPAANGEQEEIEVATPDETRVQFGGDAAAADETAEAPPAGSRETPAATEPDRAEPTPDTPDAPTTRSDASSGRRTASQSTHQRVTDPAPRPSEPGGGEEPSAVDASDADALTGAKAALGREITRLATQVEATADVDQKRALLATTREAAEALAAVRDADR